MPASPSISARSSGSTPLSGSEKCQKAPSSRASAGRAARQQRPPALAPFLERQATQRADEGDGLIGFHRRIEAALLGQIADGMGDIVRPFVAEDAAQARVGVNDAQQHAQGCGLARAVGAEDAVDGTFRHRKVNSVYGGEPVETFDEAACLYRKRPFTGRRCVARRLPFP